MKSTNLSNLLIAEDEIDINNLLTKYFSMNNYKVTGVNDGAAAYSKLKSDKYDVCLLDLNMPDKSGIDVLNQIADDEEITTSIVIVTGNKDRATIIEAMKLGAFHYIQKPFDLDELGSIVDNAVMNRKMKQENAKYKYYLEREVRKKTKEITNTYLEIVDAFANSIELRDIYTGGHSKRVSEISCLIGEELKFSDAQLEELRIGGLLHDIGKIGISDSILRKKEKLTKDEFEEIKKHPNIGGEIIKNVSTLKNVLPLVLYHQEKYDGTGYPEGLKGESIPLQARILAVADAFEAMISDRPYRKALTFDQAYEEIVKFSGKQFDPMIVRIFSKIWDSKKIKKAV